MFKNTGVEFFKYKSKEDDVELLNLDSYRVRENGVTLFCISGNGATNLQEGKDFCEIPKVYLDLMLEGADSIKENIDFIGFKYSKYEDSFDDAGDFTYSFIEGFSQKCLLPIFKNEKGSRLTLDEACRNMSKVVFFTYCAGAEKTEDIILKLSEDLTEIGYNKNEINKILSSTQNISFAPFTLNANIPTVCVVSELDQMVGENLKGVDISELKNLDGIKIIKNNFNENGEGSESILIATSSMLNSNFYNIDEHAPWIVNRDKNWQVMKYIDKNGVHHYSKNADCASQMLAWGLCRAVENAYENSQSASHISSNFQEGLVDELESIKNSFSKNDLELPHEIKHKRRKMEYDKLRDLQISELAKGMETYHQSQSEIAAQLKGAKDFYDVVKIFERNNYYFSELFLPEVDFLTDEERRILSTISHRKQTDRKIGEFKSKTSKQIMQILESCESLDEIIENAKFCNNLAGDYLQMLLSSPHKHYPLTSEEARKITSQINKDIIDRSDFNFESVKDQLVNANSIVEIVKILDVHDFYVYSDFIPACDLSKEQARTIKILGLQRKNTLAFKQTLVEFPTYEEMVDMLNNANNLDEVKDILAKHNNCGVEYVLPEVLVLTEDEKIDILKGLNSNDNSVVNNGSEVSKGEM